MSLHRKVPGEIGLPQLSLLPNKNIDIRKARQVTGRVKESLENLGHFGLLGLLGHLGFASRLPPVDLVPLDPAPELISQPREKGKRRSWEEAEEKEVRRRELQGAEKEVGGGWEELRRREAREIGGGGGWEAANLTDSERLNCLQSEAVKYRSRSCRTSSFMSLSTSLRFLQNNLELVGDKQEQQEQRPF